MSKEIERKFLVKYIPENLIIDKIIDIEQMHIYKDVKSSIRIRKIDYLYPDNKREYIYTLKVHNNYDHELIVSKDEHEYQIKEEEYKILKEQRINSVIHKTRVFVSLDNGLEAEIDLYHDYLEGFMTLEIEFPSTDIASGYNIPDWIGEEIGYKDYSNRMLANMTREDLVNALTQSKFNKISELTYQLNKYITKHYLDK